MLFSRTLERQNSHLVFSSTSCKKSGHIESRSFLYCCVVAISHKVISFQTMSWLLLNSRRSGCENFFYVDTSVKTYPHDTIVVYDSSLWRMRLCHKSTIPACYSLVNVAIGSEHFHDRIRHINRIRQSYRVNGTLNRHQTIPRKFPVDTDITTAEFSNDELDS